MIAEMNEEKETYIVLRKNKTEDKKIFVFDVDGTLSDPTMREGLLRKVPKNWVEFKSRAMEDPPHEDIIWLLKTFYDVGHTILIATARTEDERPFTEKWFKKHGVYGHYHKMYMREDKDYRDDSIIKSEMLERIVKEYGTPFMVFDDRSRVVNMWRDKGLRCLQVKPGDF